MERKHLYKFLSTFGAVSVLGIVIFLIYLHQHHQQQSEKLGYGRDCGNTISICNSTLKCAKFDNLSVCVCSSPNASHFPALGECRVALGKECDDKEGRCIPEGLCVDRLCQCKPGHKSVYCGTPFGQKCDGNLSYETCDVLNGLSCIKGICDCDPARNRVKVSGRGTCLGIPEASCDGRNEDCVSGANCEAGVCKCGQKYGVTDDKQGCKLLGGEKCKMDGNLDPCMNNLKCTNGSCICGSPYSQSLDSTRKFCSNKIGHGCKPDPEAIHPLCENGGICVPIRDTWATKDICVCNISKGIIFDNKSCIDLEVSCSIDGDCSEAHHLVCIKGKCNCGDDQMFDEERGTCVVNKGQTCNHEDMCPTGTSCVDLKCK